MQVENTAYLKYENTKYNHFRSKIFQIFLSESISNAK